MIEVMRKGYIALIPLIAFMLVLVAGAFIFGRKSYKPPQEAVSASESATPTEAPVWKHYTNAQYKFSLDYPNEFTISEGRKTELSNLIYEVNFVNMQAMRSSVSLKIFKSTSLNNEINLTKDTYLLNSRPYLLKTEKPVIVSGQTSERLDFDSQFPGNPTTVLLVPHSQDIFEFTFAYTPDNDFTEKLISNFRFTQ